MSTELQTLVEAVDQFVDPDVMLAAMVEFCWPTGVYCRT